jgi:hypothetical protein
MSPSVNPRERIITMIDTVMSAPAVAQLNPDDEG